MRRRPTPTRAPGPPCATRTQPTTTTDSRPRGERVPDVVAGRGVRVGHVHVGLALGGGLVGIEADVADIVFWRRCIIVRALRNALAGNAVVAANHGGRGEGELRAEQGGAGHGGVRPGDAHLIRKHGRVNRHAVVGGAVRAHVVFRPPAFASVVVTVIVARLIQCCRIIPEPMGCCASPQVCVSNGDSAGRPTSSVSSVGNLGVTNKDATHLCTPGSVGPGTHPVLRTRCTHCALARSTRTARSAFRRSCTSSRRTGTASRIGAPVS
jgi:hypothetical protein